MKVISNQDQLLPTEVASSAKKSCQNVCLEIWSEKIKGGGSLSVSLPNNMIRPYFKQRKHAYWNALVLEIFIYIFLIFKNEQAFFTAPNKWKVGWRDVRVSNLMKKNFFLKDNSIKMHNKPRVANRTMLLLELVI